MSQDIEGIAEDIIGKISPRSFPEDYLPGDEQTADFTIPKSEEVMMYRELEGVYVMLDGERIFFKDPYEAKYIFYCAKSGVTTVRMPGTKTLKKILKEFQNYLEHLRYEVEKETDKLGLNEKDRDLVIDACSRKLGYDLIADI